MNIYIYIYIYIYMNIYIYIYANYTPYIKNCHKKAVYSSFNGFSSIISNSYVNCTHVSDKFENLKNYHFLSKK